MHGLIHTATTELASALAKRLPALGAGWWNENVVDRLSFQQQRTVEERGIARLEQLDLAALLRVLDRNWYELSQTCALPREGRDWVRELQSVRNRWAHLSAAPVAAEDIYRDADTLARVLDMLGAAPASVAAVEAIRRAALADLAAPSDTTPNATGDPASTNEQAAAPGAPEIPVAFPQTVSALFKVGDLVGLRSDPDTVVPIIAVMPGDAEPRYQVFQDGRQAAYYESQLRPLDPADEPSLISADNLRAHLTGLHLLSPSTANLYSLRSGRVHFVPYQYRPVMRLIRADRPRLLIADEVGVGKTIEAGLIVKELRARADISSVLVICPRALVTERKWFLEMKRFDEHFEALDGRTLRHCLRETDLEGEWPDRYAKAIIPFSLFDSELLFGKNGKRIRAGAGLLALDPPPRFDLVIVDEAHHIRNADTYLHQAVRYFCDHAEAAVFLTATPVQLGSGDLFTLLNVLRPDLVIDRPSFEQMAAPNGFINAAVGHCRTGENRWQEEARACLDDAARTEWGRLFLRESPTFQDIYGRLAEQRIDGASRIRIIRSMEELYTFSPMINRTRRRDIGEFATRRPETLTVEFTSGQRRLHDDLLDVVSRILANAHGEQNVNFMMTTIRRQAASCLYGLAPLLRDMLAGKLDSLEATGGAEGDASVDTAFLAGIRADIDTLLEKTDALDPVDPKVEAFVGALQDKGRMDNNKALVFSTFRHTLAYVEQHVADAGLRYGLVHGGIRDDERSDLRRRFALPKDDPDALDVLMSSEVGGEGLDFQFCDLLINYDLPWNPMRIEQRIGRIDRYGQQGESVAIVNLMTSGTVDADIYERCLMRIGVFHHAVGGSEEILGEITQEIHNIADSFTLTPEQRAERLQQLGDNKLRQVQEEAALEDRPAELFGLTVPNQSWREEISEAESFWLSPEALRRCVTAYLVSVAGIEGNFLLGDKPLRTLRLGQKVRAKLLDDLRRQPRSTDPVARQWEKWLKGTDPLLQVTFDQETAASEPKAVYLNVLHPLVRQAAQRLERSEAVQVSLVASSETIPPGEYPFAVYQWRKVGIRSDDTLLAVASDPKLDGAVLSLLETATDAPARFPPGKGETDRLDKRHHGAWRAARANHMAENRKFVQHRRQSLNTQSPGAVRAAGEPDRRSNERQNPPDEGKRTGTRHARLRAPDCRTGEIGGKRGHSRNLDCPRCTSHYKGRWGMNVIEQVRQDRETLALTLKKHAGIRRIVEDLYPDTAHFIYELLQNAEDTGASEIAFSLSADRLVFEHNGREFNEDDIWAITDIGEGSKQGNDEQIGRFGIGFKAVFSYTETPRVWSPSYAFEISEIVLPKELALDPGLGSRTRFEFPFNSAKKSQDQAFSEIRNGLNEISDKTLLFLTHIEEIRWQVEGGQERRLLRILNSDHHLEILREIAGRPVDGSHFLRYSEAVAGLERQHVAIAFELEPRSGEQRLDTRGAFAKQFRIVPAEPGCVAVYFTAAKETSNLRFHLHAPFVSELSRSSIKDSPANEPLFRQLAGLTARSLYKIRDLGLLDRYFLGVLPKA